ncbi:MAG: hypothetical protein JXA44_05565 [Methanospirillaceae archaeon]|nr:hypothetical protein [Methanospirillaceae archaeon]
MIPILRFILTESMLRMILGTCLFLIIFATYFNISFTDPIFPDDVRPFSIYSEAGEEVYFIGIVMIDKSTHIVAMIQEKNEDWKNQSPFILSFREPPEYVNVLVNPHRNYVQENAEVIEFRTMRSVPYAEMPYVSHVSGNETDYDIRPEQIRNFFGVECKMQNITRKVSESDISLSVPVKQYRNTTVAGYREVTNLFFQIVPPKNYEVVYALPEAVLFRLVGKHYGAYEFEVNTEKTDLFILFQNRFIARDIQIIEIILGMLLSMSTYLIATGFIELAAPVHDRYKEKYDSMKMVLLRRKG